MPKRQNPFGDPFATQFKMHISQKEVDLGVNKEENMKVVYEKTLSMLYGGQKKCQTQSNGHDMNNQVNGHDMNGQLNGHHAANGHTENGHGMNGHPPNVVNGQGTTSPDVLQQLMNGGQKVTNGHHADVGEDMDIEMTDRPELVSGQSFLDANCKLVQSIPNGAMQAKGATGCHNNNIGPAPICQMCKRGKAPKSHCSFCDKLLCGDCSRQCDNCEDKFCAMCSTVNYDERYERIFCFNCSS